MSKAENKMEKILEDAGVKYQREVGFEGLYGLNHLQLRFDFIIYNENNSIRAAIEMDGI